MSTFAVVNALFMLSIGVVYGTPCLTQIAEQASQSSQSMSSQASESYSASAAGGSQYMESSSSSSTQSSSSSSSYATSSSNFDYSYYANYLSNLQYGDAYLAWLATYNADQLNYVNGILDYITVQNSLPNVFVDYSLVQSSILPAYNLLDTNSIFCSTVDLAAQTAILNQAKQNAINALNGLAPSSPLYNCLNYAINTDITMLPLALGLTNTIVNNQASYYSTSSTQSSTSSSVRSVEQSTTTSSSSSNVATASAIDTSLYQNAFTQAAINNAEAQLYLQYLSGLPSDQITYYNEIISYYNSGSQVITSDMITNFSSFQNAINSAYDLFTAKSIYAANADWVSQTAILQQAQSQLVNALSYVSPNCCLYNALNYALNNDVTYLPLVTGSYYYLLQQQSSYFTSASSATSTYSSSSTSQVASSSSSNVANVATASAIDTSLYQNAFTKAAINNAEAQLYLQYLSGLPSDQITYYNEIISYYNSGSQVITADMVTDFVSFQNAINSAYDLFAAKSIYAANADWVSQTAILQQAQSQLVNALSYVCPNCCLYNALNYALNTDVTYLPLVTGSYYYLLQQQSSYFSSAASSSSSSYSSSSSSAVSQAASASGASVAVC